VTEFCVLGPRYAGMTPNGVRPPGRLAAAGSPHATANGVLRSPPGEESGDDPGDSDDRGGALGRARRNALQCTRNQETGGPGLPAAHQARPGRSFTTDFASSRRSTPADRHGGGAHAGSRNPELARTAEGGSGRSRGDELATIHATRRDPARTSAKWRFRKTVRSLGKGAAKLPPPEWGASSDGTRLNFGRADS